MSGITFAKVAAPVFPASHVDDGGAGTGTALQLAGSRPLPVEQAPEAPSQSVFVQHADLEASFQYDQQLRQIIITLRREDTGDIVRQIPAEGIRGLLLHILQSVDNMVDTRG